MGQSAARVSVLDDSQSSVGGWGVGKLEVSVWPVTGESMSRIRTQLPCAWAEALRFRLFSHLISCTSLPPLSCSLVDLLCFSSLVASSFSDSRDDESLRLTLQLLTV